MLYCVDYYCISELCKGFVQALDAKDALRIVGENLDSRECRVVSAQVASESEITEKNITFNFRHPLVRTPHDHAQIKNCKRRCFL